MDDKILVPLDGSEFAARIIPQIEPLAEKLGSVVLLRVTTALETLIAETTPGMGASPGVVVDPQPIMAAEQADAAEYLGAMAERLRAKGFKVEVECPAGHAAITIIERAHAHGAGLIAMTTHGRTGLRHLIFGSVAEEVLRHATCPVLLVRMTEVKAHKK